MDCHAVPPVKHGDRIAPDLLRLFSRHVAGRPGLPAIECRIELIAARSVVVRARDHVARIGRVDFDVRLVVRERVVAVELYVARAGGHAFDLGLRSVLLIEASDVDRALLGHSGVGKKRAGLDRTRADEQRQHR